MAIQKEKRTQDKNKLQKTQQMKKMRNMEQKNRENKILKDKQQKAKVKQDKQIKNSKIKEDEKNFLTVEQFDKDGYLKMESNQYLSQEDELLLKQFQESSFNLGNMLNQQITQKIEEKKAKDIKDNILNDPKVRTVYNDVAKLMKEYTSGKLCRAMMAIPNLEQWEQVLELTKPFEWSPQAMNEGSKLFSSSLDQYRAQIFYEKYLLPIVKSDLAQHKKLNYHFYYSLKRAFYKPAAWFKGILFPLAENGSIREAEIIGSIMGKMSIPVVHSSVAILKLIEMNFSGPQQIFLSIFIEKNYAFPQRVINALVSFFCKFEQDTRQLPVIFYQLLEKFVKNYSNSLQDIQKEGLKQLIRKRPHKVLTGEIIKLFDQKTTQEIIEQNLQKVQGDMQIEF